MLVAGGGAAGMLAAIEAAKRGAVAAIVEKLDRPGKKLLATGNGRCNYTNLHQSKECYRSEDAGLAWRAVRKFGQADAVDMFSGMGVLPFIRDGYVYPRTGQASSVRNILCRELEKSGVTVIVGEKVRKVKAGRAAGAGTRFCVETDRGSRFADCVIVATGGMASPAHGSDGSGYGLAKSFGHSIIKPLPALSPLVVNENYAKDWAGARFRGGVCAYGGDGSRLAEDVGEIQLVKCGISGIPVFQISRFVSVELAKGKKPYIVLDAAPDCDVDEVKGELLRRKNLRMGNSAGDLFEGFLNSRLASALLKKCKTSADAPIDGVSRRLIDKIAFTIKNWRIEISKTGGFDKSQTTRGGVPLTEVDVETMESRLCEGLYFAGEVLDVDGMCGGYNLQWAWTSGHIAGAAAAKKIIPQKKKH